MISHVIPNSYSRHAYLTHSNLSFRFGSSALKGRIVVDLLDAFDYRRHRESQERATKLYRPAEIFVITIAVVGLFGIASGSNKEGCSRISPRSSSLNRLHFCKSKGREGSRQSEFASMKNLAFVGSSWTIRNLFSRKCRWTSVRNEKGRRGFVLKASTQVSSNQQVTQAMNSSRPLRLVCVGDIHSQWSEEDEMALENLNPDIALFVGDYGDEDTRVTRRIADFATAASFPVATVFGNHDAFFTASHSGRQRAPYDRNTTCRVTEQIEMLKDFDVSYRSVGFDNIPFSVCGGRAFSTGGPYWKYKPFFREFVGVHSLSHSTNKMIQAVTNSKSDVIVFLSHSGPIGLGSKAGDPCGKDWGDPTGGDYGDADLRFAIDEARNVGKRVPLVIFGHMHKALSKGRGYRTMVKAEADGTSGFETVMLNTAVFPRHGYDPHSQNSLHNFHIVQMGMTGQVDFVEEAWVTPGGGIHESTRIFSSKALSDVTCTAMTGVPSASMN